MFIRVSLREITVVAVNTEEQAHLDDDQYKEIEGEQQLHDRYRTSIQRVYLKPYNTYYEFNI